MKRTQRLDPLVFYTQKKEQLALQVMLINKNELKMELIKVEQLKSYKADYMNKQSQKNITYSSFELQEFKRFVDQLDQVIIQQTEIVKMLRQAFDHKWKIWQLIHVNLKVIHKVVDNLNKVDRLQEDKTEQKVMDELSQRKTKN